MEVLANMRLASVASETVSWYVKFGVRKNHRRTHFSSSWLNLGGPDNSVNKKRSNVVKSNFLSNFQSIFFLVSNSRYSRGLGRPNAASFLAHWLRARYDSSHASSVSWTAGHGLLLPLLSVSCSKIPGVAFDAQLQPRCRISNDLSSICSYR